uniref:Neur_chan_LBD domain-containing protein n=1 Tax=Heterorhabditis bacteriophora TaxID=37862 RepID=A0A1I7X092_HETBA
MLHVSFGVSIRRPVVFLTIWFMELSDTSVKLYREGYIYSPSDSSPECARHSPPAKSGCFNWTGWWHSFVGKRKNSEWDIISFDAEKLVTKYEDTSGGYNEYEEIFYKLKIRRKPMYYIVVILIPTFLIVTVSNIGLFTPHGVEGDREEKVDILLGRYDFDLNIISL